MYTLLTRAIVHDGDTAQMIMVNAITKPAPSIAVLRPDLPSALAAAIDKALAFEPAKRFRNAQEMQLALRTAMPMENGAVELALAARQPRLQQSNQMAMSREDLSAADEAAITVPKSPEGEARRKLIWPVITAALGSGIAVVAFIAMNNKPSEPLAVQSETATPATPPATALPSPSVSLAPNVTSSQPTSSAVRPPSAASVGPPSASAAASASSSAGPAPPRPTTKPVITSAPQPIYDRRK
jgi:hypothetical protein